MRPKLFVNLAGEPLRTWSGGAGFVLNTECLRLFQLNNLDQFSDLWNLETDWFEPPNYRHNGWSGVVRIELNTPCGGKTGAFLKRQENYDRRTLRQPVKGAPTFLREWNNLLAFQYKGIRSQTPLLFAWDKAHARAILVTRELSGFQPLDIFLHDNGANLPGPARRQLLQSIGTTISEMHHHGYRHGSLYPKHLFVKPTSNNSQPDYDIRFIDLEKTRYSIRYLQNRILDLGQFKNRCTFFSAQDWKVLMDSYLTQYALSKLIPSTWLETRINRRANRRRANI